MKNSPSVLVAVEAVPAGSKPPAAVSVRISTGERHGFGAAAPLSTRTPSLQQGRARGSMESSPKLFRHIGSGSTWAEELSSLITRSAAASSERLRVLVSGFTSASMARRDCRASCSRPAERCLVSLISVFFALALCVCRELRPSFQTPFDVIPPVLFHLITQMYLGERSYYPRGQPCSSSVAS